MISFLFAFGTTLLVFGLLLTVLEKKKQASEVSTNIRSRISRITRQSSFNQEQAKTKGAAAADKFMIIVQRLGKRLGKTKLSAKLDEKMLQADWPLTGSEYLAMLLILSGVTALFTLIITFKISLMLMVIPFICLLGLMLLNIRIQRRQAAFTAQLGNMLTMISNALRADFSFMQAMDMISQEMTPPMSREIRRVIRDTNVGIPLETALETMCRRVHTPEFELIVTAVLIQRHVGGNLAMVLDNIADTINERIRMKGEVKSITAQGRLSGVIMGALPLVLGLILYTSNPSYIMPLFQEPLGRLAIAYGLTSELIGFIVMNRIVDIEL